MNKIIVLYIAVSSKKEARKIAKDLLEKRLIGCANIWPMQSFYWWQGKINCQAEAGLIVKTTAKNLVKTKKAIKKIHSYTTPAIIKIPAMADKNYFQWIKKEARSSA